MGGNGVAEKLRFEYNKSCSRKKAKKLPIQILQPKDLMRKLTGEDVAKMKMLNVASQMFLQYEKEIDESNQILKIMKFASGLRKKLM